MRITKFRPQMVTNYLFRGDATLHITYSNHSIVLNFSIWLIFFLKVQKYLEVTGKNKESAQNRLSGPGEVSDKNFATHQRFW